MPRLYTRVCILFCIGLLVQLIATPTEAKLGVLAPVQQSGCPVQPLPPSTVDGGELTDTQKTDAFSDALANGNTYQDYNFTLDTSNTPSDVLPPVLVKSVGGIESGWRQYEPDINGQLVTLRGTNPNDYGMLQINSGCPDNPVRSIFSKTPSLLSNTRANIAAGAETLKEKWNAGANGPSPIVNDQDPGQLLNWYYAISSYNNGPSGPTPSQPSGLWTNNPTCNRTYTYCNGYDYRDSRPWEANPATPVTSVDWANTPQGSYPYQEQVLYNLQFPKYPSGGLWSVQDLGLKQVVSRGDYGIRPDDALFVSSSGASRAPNLLLFRHQASLVSTSLPSQSFLVEYELPVAATVTIELLDAPVNGSVVASLLTNAPRSAGWNTERLVINTTIGANYAYRIRAVVGSPGTPATYFEGQYVQILTTITSGNQNQQFLPFITSDSSPVSSNALRNGLFSDANANAQPQYWNIQAIYGSGVSALQKVTLVPIGGSIAQYLQIAAAPEGRVELSQRVHLPAPGNYRLTYTLNVANATVVDSPATSLRVRTRDTTGTVWIGANFLDIPSRNNTSFSYCNTIDAPAGRQDQIISFLAQFSPNDSSSKLYLTQVALTPGQCP